MYFGDFWKKIQIQFLHDWDGGSKRETTKSPFILPLSWVGENTKYCPFIMSPRVDKPAVDCELEPNNQSAVVSIVMLSPMGKKEWQRDIWQSAPCLDVLCHEGTKNINLEFKAQIKLEIVWQSGMFLITCWFVTWARLLH